MTTDGLLLPYQVRWNRDRAQVKVWEKSRRIGASYAEALEAVLHAAAADRGGDVYYISYNKDMTATFINDCATWARAVHTGAGAIGESLFRRDDDRDIHVFDMSFASGHQIQTFSNNPRNLRSKGRPGDRVIIDEAAFVDDIDELLKAAMAVTMWGGEIRILSTHNGADNPFNVLIEDTRAGRFDYSIHRTTLDDALTDGLYRKICQVTGKDWSAEAEHDWREGLIRRYRPNHDEELFVVPAQGGGSYLPRSLIEAVLPPPGSGGPLLRFDGSAAFNAAPEQARRLDMDDWLMRHCLPVLAALDPDRRHVLGMDFARSGDMTSIVLVEIAADTRHRWRAVVELHNVPFRQQQQALWTLIDGLPRFSGGALDAGGNGAQLAEETADRYGSLLIQQVKFTEAVYRDAFPLYKARIEDRQIELIRHDDVIEDHRAVQYVRGVPRVPDRKTDSRGQRHGDSAIAGLLAHMAASAEPPDLRTIATAGAGASAFLGLTAGPAGADFSPVGWGAASAGLPFDSL